MNAVGASFPRDIEIDILSSLPTKSLVRLACTCKSWIPLINYVFNRQALMGLNNRILIWPLRELAMTEYVCLPSLNPETLIKTRKYKVAKTCVGLPTTGNFKSWYLMSSSTENQDNFGLCQGCQLHIIGSSNGLICFTIDRDGVSNLTILWCPLTRFYKKLPPCPLILCRPDGMEEYQVWGFGYDVSSGDYNVLARVRSRYIKVRLFQVYSLQANTWRVLACDFPYCILETSYRSVQTPLNGALHWLTRKTTGVNPQGQITVVNGIVAFNLAEEKFWDFPLADEIAKIDKDAALSLTILNGRLCAYFSHTYYSTKTEIWVMKEYGAKESWERWVSVTKFQNFQPIYMSQNKEILALIDHMQGQDLVTYNPTRKTYRVIKSLCRFQRFCGVVYGESLASPSTMNHPKWTAAVQQQPQPTGWNSLITNGPKAHVTEDDVALYVEIDLPGVDKDGLQVWKDKRDVIHTLMHIVAKEGGKDPEFDMGEGKETTMYYWGIKLYWGMFQERDPKVKLRNGVVKLIFPKLGDLGAILFARFG